MDAANDFPTLGLDGVQRTQLWQSLIDAIERYAENVSDLPVAPALDPKALRDHLATLDFSRPMSPSDALTFAVEALWRDQVHTAHPSYFGLFNPAPSTMGIAADALVAAFNPQLAAWSHSPFAAEVERLLVRTFAAKLGHDPVHADGTLATGGMEANHTAVLTALRHVFPTIADGVATLVARPALYVSREGHDSIRKAARLCGLGDRACRAVPTTDDLAIDVAALDRMITRDRADGFAPFLVVATAGTTSAGAIDPIARIADLARREHLWVHVDAAWGGAAALVPELRQHLDGIERADSVTLDAHKWLSVPMGAGMFLTRHPDILEQTFRVDQRYMPREARHLDVIDPWAHSMQWSRRFIGLKILMTLMVAGWGGYEQMIRHQVTMGDLLRQRLIEHGFRVVNRTPLPLVCFVDATRPNGGDGDYLDMLCARVVGAGRAWISVPRIGNDQAAIRACITNYHTRPEHINALVEALVAARR